MRITTITARMTFGWISRYISVYLWLPIADLFAAVLAKIQTLMLQADVLAPVSYTHLDVYKRQA